MKANVLFIFIICTGFFFTGEAQNFKKRYKGTSPTSSDLRDMIQTSDQGFIMVGSSNVDGSGGADAWIIKTDVDGNIVWTKTYGGSNADMINSIRETSDGGYIAAGYTNSFGQGMSDIFVLRLNNLGEIVWSKVMGGTSYDALYSIEEAPGGDFIAAGSSSSFISGSAIYLLRFSPIGDTLWTKVYSTNGDEYASDLKILRSDSSFVIAGLQVTANGRKALAAKFDKNGNILWAKNHGASPLSLEEGTAITLLPDKGFLLVGSSNKFTSPNQYNMYAVKLDSMGAHKWSKCYGGSASEFATSVDTVSGGGYVIAGNSYGLGEDYYIIKTDTSGNTLFSKFFRAVNSDLEIPYAITETSTGFAIAGTKSNFNNGDYMFSLMATDKDLSISCESSNTTSHSTVVTPTVSSNANFTNIYQGGVITNHTLDAGSGGLASNICAVTAIEGGEEENKQLVLVYPQPTSSDVIFDIHSDVPQGLQFSLYDSFGRVVRTQIMTSGINELKKKELKNGIYFWNLKTADNIYWQEGKLMIE